MRLRSIGIATACAFLGVGQSVRADPIEVPNVFTAGATARAADVNENFEVVEAAINDHDSRITDNTNDVAAITTEVQALRGPVAVFDGDGNEIGLLIGDGTYERQVKILSERGYGFDLLMATGHIRQMSGPVPLYYSTSNCSGPTYSFLVPAGMVFRTDSGVYYVDRDSTPIPITNGSYWSSPGVCANLVDLDAVWPALPNDPTVTGVNEQPHPLPIKLGRP